MNMKLHETLIIFNRNQEFITNIQTFLKIAYNLSYVSRKRYFTHLYTVIQVQVLFSRECHIFVGLYINVTVLH